LRRDRIGRLDFSVAGQVAGWGVRRARTLDQGCGWESSQIRRP